MVTLPASSNTRHDQGVVPSFDDFASRIASAPAGVRSIPIYREILADLETPVSAYLKLSEGLTKPGFILESVEGGIRIARYSFIGADPVSTLTLRDGSIEQHSATGPTFAEYVDPLVALAGILDQYKTGPDISLP